MGHSRSSSSSSNGSESKHKHKDKKDKKDKKKHDKDKDKHHYPSTPSFPASPQHGGAPWGISAPMQGSHSQIPVVSDAHGLRAPSPQPPSYQRAPPSGFRIPLTTDAAFPPHEQAGTPPCVDADGISPVYFGSALFPNSVHPCKVAPGLSTPCRVSYGGSEREHRGRYDLLPFTQEMELIPASGGHIPPGRRPVEGGYEENTDSNGRHQKLYHAVATINGVRVPGKCGEHLMGANVPFGNSEAFVRDYELLVWKQ